MHVSSNICTYNKDLFICEISFCIYDLVIGDREINYVLSSFSLAIPRFYFVCQPNIRLSSPIAIHSCNFLSCYYSFSVSFEPWYACIYGDISFHCYCIHHNLIWLTLNRNGQKHINARIHAANSMSNSATDEPREQRHREIWRLDWAMIWFKSEHLSPCKYSSVHFNIREYALFSVRSYTLACVHIRDNFMILSYSGNILWCLSAIQHTYFTCADFSC